jgi:hypothetical protein
VVLPVSHIDSAFLSHFQLTSGITAGEGTTSLTLSDGRVLWLFGQSHLNDYNSSTGLITCSPNVHNAAMTTNTVWSTNTLNTGTNDFIPSNESGTWFKPLHAYQYADTVFVFAKKEGAGNNTRTFVAKFHFPDLTYLRIDSFHFNNTNYGYSVLTDMSVGFGYVFGLYQPDLNGMNGMFLARFPLNSLHDNWQYYSADLQKWMDPSNAGTPLAQVPGENFSVCKIRNKYILLTQEAGKTCNQGAKIYSQTSAYIYGTYKNYQLLHTITDQMGGITPATYGVSLHPQFLNTSDEVLVTYTVNGYEPCILTCSGGYDNPDYYRVKTLRVGLKKIDPAF